MSERTLSGVNMGDLPVKKPSIGQAVPSEGSFHGHHAALAKVKKRKAERVQIKCPVGSPNSLIVPKKVAVNEDYARHTFHMFDRKHVGYFLHKDVRRVFADSEHGHYNEFLNRFDANNDGKVEWDEFLGTMNEFIEEKGELNFFERIYITFSEPESSKLAKAFSILVMILIIVSTLSFVVDSVPRFHAFGDKREGSFFDESLQVAPGEECPGKAKYVCGEEYMKSHTPTMEPTMAPTLGGSRMPSVDDGAYEGAICYCPPTKHRVFEYIEIVCILIFTVEYMARLLTAWAARFGEKFEIVLDIVTMPKPANPALARTWAYVTNTMNLIDFFAILPFYIDLLPTTGDGLPLGFLRVLRLARVFRVFKMGKYSKGMSLLTNVLINSAPALRLLCFFSLIGMILFGSMIFFCEQGEWMVTADFPEGAYLRMDVTGTQYEPSPFVSIPSCFWWVIVTQTTVGYGDQYPVTDVGKVVGSFCMVSGILVLALPITIIGANFANEYAKVQAEEARERMELAAELAEDAAREAAQAAEEHMRSKHGGGSDKKPKMKRGQSFVGGMSKAMGLGGKSSARVAADAAEAAEAIAAAASTSDPVTPFDQNDVPSRRTMFDSRKSDGSDSDSDDEEDMDIIRMTKVRSEMNRKSSDLTLMIREYIETAKVSAKASTAMLDEVNELLELLSDEEAKHIDVEKTMAMVNICFVWLKKCDDDPSVVTNTRHRELLLRAIFEFAASTVGTELPGV